MKKFSIIQTFALFLIVAIAFITVFFDTIGPLLSSIITTLITVAGAITVWFQMRKNGETVAAETIIQLNKLFTKAPGLCALRDKLQVSVNPKDFSEKGKYKGKDTTGADGSEISDDDVNIIEYLEFFENMAVMVLDGVLSIKNIDTCFGNNFFYAVNNEYMQNREIIPYKEHYINTIKLHWLWTEYRKAHNIAVPYAETSLQKTLASYNEIIKGGAI